jgi:sigma-B regulation protein RsbU (phosphoserine phosphatase)
MHKFGFARLETPQSASFELLEKWLARHPEGVELVLPILDSDQEEIIAVIGFGASHSPNIDISEESNYLESLSLVAGVALTNARLFAREKELRATEAQLEIAREIQERLLPQRLPNISGLTFATYWKQSQQVGGDYFDVIDLGSGKALIVIADVVGKGITAAILMSHFQASLRALVTGFSASAYDLGLLINKLNRLIYESTVTERYVTTAISLVDSQSREVTTAVCGHPRPFIQHGDDPAEIIPTSGPPIGIFADATFILDTKVCSTHDRIVYYTDGLSEAHPFGSTKMLSGTGVVDLVREVGELTQPELVRVIETPNLLDIEDDLTIVVVEFA